MKIYLKDHAYLYNIYSTKHDEEMGKQNELQMLFSEEVAPPSLMEVVLVAFYNIGRIIISLILYIPCVGFCVGIIIIEMFSSVIR